MDRYFLLEFSSDGIALETAQVDFYASWLGIGIVLVSIIAYKVYKKRNRRI
jgi:multidrug transporter EmrE-like cation transporter